MQIGVASRPQVSAGIPQTYDGSTPMMDVVMVALAVGFFAVSIAYVFACERL
jgi:hypothetical protein